MFFQPKFLCERGKRTIEALSFRFDGRGYGLWLVLPVEFRLCL